MTLRALAEGIITHDRAAQLCPDCLTDPAIPPQQTERLSPSALRKLPKEQRDAIVSASAEAAMEQYANNASLTDFEAFGKEDFYDTQRESD